jgi:diguanylate cyclase (GGDEF)-like protein/PAS domain S-box-containing protein
MLRTLTTATARSAATSVFQRPGEATTKDSVQYGSGAIVSHTILCVSGFLLYLLLNRPGVILLSRLGATAWYPAVGLAFALMLAISPRYMPVFAIAGSLAGMLFYHQPFHSWGTLVGNPLGTGVYAVAAHVLRGPVRIDNSLGQRRDVMRYVLVTSAAAVFASLAGVLCLMGDHTIQGSQFWAAALNWYIGDTIGLLSVAPFLLIHVLPWVSKRISAPKTGGNNSKLAKTSPGLTYFQILEFTCQAAAFVVLFWIMFGAPPSMQLFYPAFLPIIWIAMRQGIRGAATGLLALNFGIVVSLRLTSTSAEVFTKLGLLMLAVSATGLILGSAVSERQRIANDLKEHTVFLNSLIENSPFGIVVEGPDRKIQLCNRAFENLFLYSSAEIIGRDLKDLIIPDESRAESKRFAAQVISGDAVHSTVRRVRKDGHVVEVEIHALPLFQDGQVEGGYVIYKDISEQVKASAAAKEHEEAMNHWVGELELRTMQITLLNEMGGLLQCAESSDEAYAVVGQSAKKLFGEATSGALFIHKHSQHSVEIVANWGSGRVGEPVFAAGDCWSLRTSQPHWSECPAQGIVCTHVDKSIAASYLCVPMMAHGETQGVLQLRCEPDSSGDAETEQKARESLKRLAVAAASQIALSHANLRLRETLREQSIRDPLTGLFNRRFLQESLDKELQRAKRKKRSLAILFLDLDNFKCFNDTFGHDAGDSVLQSMAETFRSQFRAEDVICRYGGEEFAVILPESSIQDAVKRAEALRLTAKGLKLAHRGVPLDPVTLSIGIVVFPDHGENAQELLERADKCLYQSKANGRDRVTAASASDPGTILT